MWVEVKKQLDGGGDKSEGVKVTLFVVGGVVHSYTHVHKSW